jgi:hypothetical protein
MNTKSTWQRATELLPPAIRQRIKGAENLTSFVENVSRYHAMPDADLLHATVACLLNLERLDDSVPSPDVELRTVLVPELWERLQGGTRDRLLRLTSTLAEYNPSSLWRRSRFWSAAQEAATCLAARRLRQRISQAESADTAILIEQVRFAIAGSHADANWGRATGRPVIREEIREVKPSASPTGPVVPCSALFPEVCVVGTSRTAL